MSDTRPIASFRFGLEWEPKLAEIMLQHPWRDSDFAMSDPKTVCKKCGRAEMSINHSPASHDMHDFEASPPFTEQQIEASREEWRRRMTGLPTKEALEAWHRTHSTSMSKLMALLMSCAIKTRDDVERLGCTGCAAMGLVLDDIQFLRIGLAGSGVGLPCFVPPDRYCLAHEVSGGLQDGQDQKYPGHVEKVARPLTAQEQAHDKLVSAARRSEREHGAHSMLHGHTLPRGWEETMDGADGGAQVDTSDAVWGEESGTDGPIASGGFSRVVIHGGATKPWKCSEHDKTVWNCRHCVAQAVVDGELMPHYILDAEHPTSPSGSTVCEGGKVDEKIQFEEDAGSYRVTLYVRVATFTRKLSRD